MVSKNDKSSPDLFSELQICIFNCPFESYFVVLMVIENSNVSQTDCTMPLTPTPPMGFSSSCWHVRTLRYHPPTCSYLKVSLDFSRAFSHCTQHTTKSSWFLIQNTSRI